MITNKEAGRAQVAVAAGGVTGSPAGTTQVAVAAGGMKGRRLAGRLKGRRATRVLAAAGALSNFEGLVSRAHFRHAGLFSGV